jgi:Flp pilus assembly protein TadB
MIEFFKDGGWSMFVILLFGAIALATAALHAARPDARREGFLKGMARAVMWATLAGAASDLGTTWQFTSKIVDDTERSRTTLEGLAESMSPLIMGFVILAIVAFLAAIGRRRLDARRA